MGILRNCSVPFVVTTAVLIAISAITRVSATTLPDHVTAAYRESNTAYVPAFFMLKPMPVNELPDLKKRHLKKSPCRSQKRRRRG